MNEPTKPEVVVLNAVLELPAGERAAFLDQACAGNESLRQQVKALLNAHEQAGGFLSAPPARVDFKRTMLMNVLPTEKPGDKIGNYKLLQQIGEGGCGVVYMAEQEEPVRRRVALKVIKLGMDTKEVIARFEAERQALALMDHPNIAKVLDAGATRTGRPYFVMELVRGIKITDYCDENKISTEERLKLFIQVCQAIQHAHQKGIIHRDIKPSNILVTVNDGVPVPKVIDFGIAKATAGRLTDKTLFTAFDQFIGTPAYMSPEQAVMTSLDIDTRSDIYSLGVLLYELLTGKTPFDANELLQSGLDEMRRTIREIEPPKPSTRLSTMLDAERTATATHRHTDPPKLVHLVRGDLDWIVMRALEKDRARRYETANGLAADINRHLGNEPVNASPPSRLYRLQKSVRRNKGAFAAATVIAVVLMIGVIASTSEAIRATRAEREQIHMRLKAETNEKKSEQVAQFLKDMLNGAGPSVARGRDATVLREILDQTSRRVGRELKDQPEVQGDIWLTLGNTYVDIGDYEGAIPNLQQAADVYRTVSVNHDTQRALALGLLGRCQSYTGDFEDGRSNAQAGLELARKSGDMEVIAVCLVDMARSFSFRGQTSSEGLPFLREAVALQRQQSTNPVALGENLSSLSAYTMWTDIAESESLVREALALHHQYLEPDHPTIASDMFMLGEVLLQRYKRKEAEKVLRETLVLFRKIYDQKNPSQVLVLRYLAEVLAFEGRWDEAESTILEAVESYPSSGDYRDLYGCFLAQKNDWASAAEQFERAELLNTNDDVIRFHRTIALLKSNNLEEYRKCCHEFLMRTANTHKLPSKDMAAKVSLLLPTGGPDFDLACQLADQAVTNELKRLNPWPFLAKALADYRRGRLASAKDYADRAISSEFIGWGDCQAGACFIRSAACASLHQPELARAALAAGDENAKLPENTYNDIFVTWHNRAINDYLRREAIALIESQPTPAK